MDSVAGANLSAAATVDASVGIDHVDVSGGDGIGGANSLACTAGDAVVVDYVSHSFI